MNKPRDRSRHGMDAIDALFLAWNNLAASNVQP
jgi:hypothetical protein